MIDNIDVKDFIIEHKDTIFIYSVLIALESVLMIFKGTSQINDNGIFQAALLCGITLLFLIWMKFIWSAIGYLHIRNINSIKNAFLVAQNAIFSI